jgi:hypothetical protein
MVIGHGIQYSLSLSLLKPDFVLLPLVHRLHLHSFPYPALASLRIGTKKVDSISIKI